MLGLFLALAGVFGANPPTLDPTYGLPVPGSVRKPINPAQEADWIWTRESLDDQTVYFRKGFNLDSIPKDANLYIAAEDTYDLFVNGQELGRGTDWRHAGKYKLTNLRVGRNAVAVVAGHKTGPAGLLARLESDGKPILLTNWTWFQSETEPVSDWKSADYDDSKWTGALRIQSAGGDPWGIQPTGWPVRLSDPAPYLFHKEMAPVLYAWIPANGDKGLNWDPTSGEFIWFKGQGLHLRQWSGPETWDLVKVKGAVIDFGQELTGRVVINSSKALTVRVGTGESANEAMIRPWITNDLDLKPGKSSSTTYTALRYAAITFPEGVTSGDIRVSVDHLYYPVEYKGSFDCSDPILTRIWYTGAYTAHSCMQQDIWDAPKRDRMPWMGDLHVSGEVINNVFLDRYLMEHTLSLLRQEAQGDKPFNGLTVNHVNGIPGYSCAWIAGLYDFFLHTGDLSYLKSQHDALISMLEYFRGELDESGLFANKLGKWPFVDWSPDFDKDTPQTRAATHLFFTLAVKHGSYLLKAIGDQTSGGKYEAWFRDLEKAARSYLADANGTYGDRRQENAMAVYSGVATRDQRESIWEKVLNPDSPSWNQIASPYYNNYVIFAMSLCGHTREALEFVRKYWGGMLDQGATTFWEAYDPGWEKKDFHAHLEADGSQGYFVSLCHGWSAGCTNFLTERVLGVRSTGPGFKTCEIAPELCDLKWASGSVPTPHGLIKVRALQEARKLILAVDIPRGVTATLRADGRSFMVGAGRHELD